MFAADAGEDGSNATDPPSKPEAGSDGSVADAGVDVDAAPTLHCSSDLHQILDQNDDVVTTCPPDQGCAGNQCIPACDAAAQSGNGIGCAYYVSPPDAIPEAGGGCFAAFVVNTWATPVKLTVERDGQTLDVDGMTRLPKGSGAGTTYEPLVNGEIPANDVALVFLSRFGNATSNCPGGVTPGYTSDFSNVRGTGIGAAFHITATGPIAAYDIYPYGGGSSAASGATLLYPTSAWGTNYVGVNAYRQTAVVPGGQNFLQVVAEDDATEVKILPIMSIAGGPGVSAVPANTTGVFQLNRGQILQFTQDGELTGSAIEANKPIGVFGGASALNIDVSAVAADVAHQQLPPVRAWGSRYVGVRYRNRFDGVEETPPWRIVGAVDGTTLTYEPSAPPGAPTSIDEGQVLEFSAAGPFVVKSQDDKHPFYVSAHMTGCGTVHSSDDCRGDPEFVNVVSPEQYLKAYVFFTDPTYPETDLVIVRQKSAGGFSDVTLDCAGALTGWQPVGTAGDFEYTRFDLVRGNFEAQGACNNGRHEISSAGLFGVTVWGWGSAATGGNFGGTNFTQAVSYAYPAGGGLKTVNTVVVPTTPH